MIKYPYVRMGRLVSMRITDIYIKFKIAVFYVGQFVRIQKKTHNDIRFSKQIKMIIVVDKWLDSLMLTS